MRKIGFAHCNNQIKEILPRSYRVESLRRKRKMFFTMINEFLSPKARICTKDANVFDADILSIFIGKIESFFPIYKLRPQSAQKVRKIYAEESLLFHQFFKVSSLEKFRYLSDKHVFWSRFKPKKEYKHPAAQLMAMIFNGKEIEMMMDLDMVFAQTVYKRIPREGDKKITLDYPYIHINQNGITTRLYPQWKKLDPNRLETRKKEISQSLDDLHDKPIDQCYMVYPKTQNFQKHIRIRHAKDTREIKLIPYSFTFCNRK